MLLGSGSRPFFSPAYAAKPQIARQRPGGDYLMQAVTISCPSLARLTDLILHWDAKNRSEPPRRTHC